MKSSSVISDSFKVNEQGLSPYAEYKKSGIDWLSTVPSHWLVTTVKRFANFTTGWTPPTGKDEFFGGKHLWANISDLGSKYINDTAKTLTDSGISVSRLQKSPKGSLLFSFKLSIGRVSIVAQDLYTNEAIATFLPSNTINIPFMYWAAPIFIPENAEENIYGAKLLNQERISNACFVLPPSEEQYTIAAFLDYETARIDQLIAKQQRLIELLKEKRQAAISHAVTKGLNPDAPMKVSGVEWLGQVPEHWKICRLKQVIECGTSISYGIVQPGDALDEGVPFIQTTNISRGNLSLDELPKTSALIEKNYPRSRLIGGEVILGIRASIGAAYVVPSELKGANLSRGVARIQTNEVLSSEFLVRFFQSNSVEQYWGLSKQGSTFSEVSIETVRELYVVIPPKNEQNEICSQLDLITNKFDSLITLAEQQNILLWERRTALISAAVTGKIDVRGWVKPEEPSASDAA